MLSANRGIWQALIPLWFLLFGVFAPAGCACGPERQVQSSKPIACRPQHDRHAISPPLASKTIVAGTIPASFAVTDSGDAAMSMPLEVPPGRAGVEPSLAISYSSSSGDGVLGTGFSITGASSITRCPKTMAIDGEIRAVQYDVDDALCLDGKRLVVVAENDTTIEYRTFPDSQVKVIGHLIGDESHFEAFLSSGWVVEYGETAGSRPLARNGAPRTWLATETRDARGNSMSYGYCFAESDEGFTAEYALDEIRYTGFDGEKGTRAVSFVYGTKNPDDVRKTYSGGMEFQNALRLDEVQTRVEGELVRRYEFAYEQGETTGRTRLVSAQECGADGECKPETRFQYAKALTGFDRVATNLLAPMSRLSSPMLADFNGDGLDDLLLPDTTALSTPLNPITEWRIAKNQGQTFAPPSIAFTQFWAPILDPEGMADPAQIQPELGTAIDFDQDGRMDVLLHDVYGRQGNHIVLRSKPDGTFEEINTQIKRPFPIGPAPKQLRSAGGSVHLADVDGNGVADLIQCEDHGDSAAGNPSQPEWTLRVWTSGGYVTNHSTIDPLAGIGCDIDLRTVDVNRDGKVDLVLPGMVRVGGTPSLQTTTYSALEFVNWSWHACDTNLHIPPSPGRVIFADVNADGLPDAITNGISDRRLRTWMNEDGHFAANAVDSLDWDGLFPQDAYFHLATPLDFDGDGRTDLLIPMSEPPELPKWYILRATNGANTFERIDAGIPFEAQLGENGVNLADPRGPRIGDVNGDGAPDVVLFIGNELQIFQNRASNPDVLVSFSDGLNEHEPEDSGFVPNVSFSYGHLIDESITNEEQSKDLKREAHLYLSRSDLSNDCDYPRRCAVGSRRVVREYATNDGQGGVRRFGLRYRDGRYDRRGHGFLGFGERIVTDLDTNAGTSTFYDNETLIKVGARDVYPFAGQVKSQWRWAPALPNESKQNRVELVFADSMHEVVPTNDGQTYFTLSTKRHSRRMQGMLPAGTSLEAWVAAVEAAENATMLRDTTTDVVDFDAFGNVLEVNVATVGVDLTYHVTRIVKNDSARWILGQVQSQTECSKAGANEKCREFTYTTNEFGEADKVETSSNDNIPDTKLTVKYDKRDRYGNVEHVTAEDEFGHVRESTRVFDDEGVFPTKEINALLHETTLEHDRRFGTLAKETDPNQLVTEWQYDSLGRETLEIRPDGSQTTTTLSRSKLDGLWRLSERTTTTGGSDDETIFDSLGRPIRTFSHDPTPEGQKMPRRLQVFQYDRLSGKTMKRSVTAAEGTPDADLLFDAYEFDSIGREIRHTTPWNATTTTTYDGFVVDSTDLTVTPPRLTRTQLDVLGRPVIVTDAAKGKTSYTYGPFNTLRTATDPGGATTRWTLDALGQVRKIEQPDRGATNFVNDGFGDQMSSTDALGRTIAWEYDALGRTTKRTDTHAGKTLTTSWTWDTAANGVGALHTLMSPDALKTYSYSKRGQLDSVTLTVDNESFVMGMSYDAFGRAKSIRYPQPLGQEPFEILREYDTHGHVIAVRDAGTRDAYWELTDVDEAGRYAEETLGNGVTTARMYDNAKESLTSISTIFGATKIQDLSYEWTDRLNLKSRTDALQLQNKTEWFRYDQIDRVKCAYFGPVENALAPCVTAYGYTLDGNLAAKSDVGTFQYKDLAHPHAVTHAGSGAYAYDAVGNQVARPGGVSVTYTPFDLPKTATKNGQTTTFEYDGDEQRIRKTSSNSEIIYVGELFEQITNGIATSFRYYVHSPERVIAVVTRGGGETGTNYLHVDHLGSVESVTNENGVVVEKRSYDAFGARRNPEWGGPSISIAGKTKKGFTGHEEEDEFGLINMKGRLYDPKLGRFTTTDPVISDIFNGQTLNPFSYVRNNPLTLVDPNGFNEEEARRLWRVEETPGQLGVRITFDKLPESTPNQPPPEKVGGAAPTNDTATTGTAPSPTSQTVPTNPDAPSAAEDFLEGMGERALELLPQLAWGIIDANMGGAASTLVQAKPGDLRWDGAGERFADKLNEANPLYAAGVDVVDGANAYENSDFVGLGRATLGFGVTVVMTVLTLKGAKTTRGPPKAETVHDHHVMTNKNRVSTSQGGPWTPRFEDMAQKAGMKLSDAANRIKISGHHGPHPEAYHFEVHRRLARATKSLTGDAYSKAFRNELEMIRTEAATSGSALNQLLTGTRQ